MSPTAAARTRPRGALRASAAGLAILTAAIIGILDAQPGLPSVPLLDVLRDQGAATEQDGALPDGATVFDSWYPGVGKLEPELLQALREAAVDAAGDGIGFAVNSGWRSPAYQNRLLHRAIWRYGSHAQAARWVATAETSAHVSGDAVDIGPPAAAAWLSRHGAEHGLCQIYDNEPWHWELRRQAVLGGCPPRYPDLTLDPRMRR